MREKIAIDMDETIVDTLVRHLEWYNREFEQQLTKTALHGRKIYDCVAPEQVMAVRAYPDHPEFFMDIPPCADAIDVVRELSERYEIFIATAAMEHPTSFAAKYHWLATHLPFISPLNFIFCGYKGIINVDYLLDDSSRHFREFSGQGILFSAPHNLLEVAEKRVNNWQEVRNLFL